MGGFEHSLFFYGTLLHPKVLKRVIGNDGEHLRISPALLIDYTRHKIKNADYPAIVPISKSQALFDRELTREERSVRGTVVTGLTQADIDLLDIFEGDEYTREHASVYLLRGFEQLNHPSNDLVTASPPPVPKSADLGNSCKTETYVWAAPLSHLTPELWSFDVFVRENVWKWIGRGADENEDYKEVDRRREMNGTIIRATDETPPLE